LQGFVYSFSKEKRKSGRKQKRIMKIIAGLGNPTKQYENTLHNLGFSAVDVFLRALSEDAKKKECEALTAHIRAGDAARLFGAGASVKNGVKADEKVIIAKPQTYMNLSGGAVLALMTYYKIPLENLIVIHDDMDLKVGSVREKVGGGSAGHNGIKSIDACVGREYRRVRIGVGHPRDTDSPLDPADWVLRRFYSAELAEINRVIQALQL
jgi:PTH1 family peptidyl-tRNA hydrolase